MQCVIICAGKGTRMLPLTESTPKPLIEVCGKPILQHVVEALPEEVTELVLVVGYLQEQIRTHCGETYLGKKVTYVEQENFSGGTGDALLCAKGVLTDRFLFMYADDIHGAAALKEAVQHEHAILATHSESPEHFGVLIQNEDGTLQGIIEKPKDPPSNFINIGGFVLDTHIFEYTVAVSEEHGELLVTDMFTQYAQDYPVDVVPQDLWIPVGKPEDIEKAEVVLCPEK
tara:strand:- start:16 stop:702 length:687 start_codon:yes stop_codon:yes gene_type:complete